MFEAIVLFAMEVCADSRNQAGCHHWLHNCMVNELATQQRFDFDDSGERCIETMPREIWPRG